MSALILLLAVFAVTILIAYMLIIRIPPKLHTPLMSLTNAISAVTVLGAILLFASPAPVWVRLIGGIALASVAFNLIGGFVLTHRILRMFHD